MSKIRPLVKYHGGKGRLHQWVISQFPPHHTYIEPFGGAASVLLNKPSSQVEIYNELEPDMFNLMYIIKTDFDAFLAGVSAFVYSKPVFLEQKSLHKANQFDSELSRAVCFYAVKRMSRGGLCQRFSWSDRIYSTGPAEEHCWNTALGNLSKVRDRLLSVEIQNQNAFDLIPKYINDPDCLLYLDPPYLTSTRNFKKAYNFECSVQEHERLASLLKNASAKVILSGYGSALYDKWFSGWSKSIKDVANHASQYNGKEKVRKQETLWMNYTLSTN